MDESKTPELTVDCEFRDLIRPLLKDEYRHLEAALLADGCREPITVWKGIIVDGHNRYEICRRLGIPFEVRERHFDNREEAIIWICANQLGRRNISDETRRYLIGKRYEAEKVIAGRRNYSGWNQYRKREQSGDLPYEVIEPDAQQERIRTSQRIGEEYHLAHGTVEKYGAYSKAVDQIAKKDPSMLPRILSGRYKISHENVLALSRMSQQEVKRFGRQMKAMRQSSTVVPYGVSRSQLGQITPKPQITLQPGIKNMPDFDPDAAIAGLTLTIPSWTSSINRALNSSNMNTVSIKARTNLQQALMNLQATIAVFAKAADGDVHIQANVAVHHAEGHGAGRSILVADNLLRIEEVDARVAPGLTAEGKPIEGGFQNGFHLVAIERAAEEAGFVALFKDILARLGAEIDDFFPDPRSSCTGRRPRRQHCRPK